MQKVQNVESINTQSDCETMCKKRTYSSSVSVCLYAVKKYEKVDSVNTQSDDYKTTTSKWTDKKNLFCEFYKSV